MLAAAVTFFIPAAQARVHHSDAWAREHFTTAEQMRDALNARPTAERTRRDYQRVVNAYRLVYTGAPTSSKADPSVVAVADTLVEMGRRFDDDKILNEAIAQYKFLRREYPGSKDRPQGLFAIGEIYQDDLNRPEEARAIFQEFLRHYPHNHLAEDARQALAELDQPAKAGKPSLETKKATEKSLAQGDAGDREATASRENSDSGKALATDMAGETRPTRRPRVTGIRHWSTPEYTRVAIDLEGDVQFSSQRIARPARIFFDLRNTKLASSLVGKSFDVDDGFLKKVRIAQFAPGRTRVVLDVDNLSEYDAFLMPNPYRLIIDIRAKDGQARRNEKTSSLPTDAAAALLPRTKSEPDAIPAETTAAVAHAAADTGDVPSSTSDEVTSAKAKTTFDKPAIVKKIVDADDDGDPTAAVAQEEGRRNTRSRSGVATKQFASSGTREARPTAGGDRSLIRALGLKIGKIVIDPGHGGHDTGTIGPNGLEEKDLVLEVSRRLGKLLETRLGAEVVYTRKDDTFIPLETRTAIANQAHADLFVSIHANSSHDEAARGVETYYLNFTSSPEALEVAARENAVSEKSIYELQDLVKKIALKEKIEESREFAGDVQASLHSGLAVKSPAIRDRGVKKAPFIVLIGANMPSILAEISFVSNPTDEHRLATSEYRERIAESLYRGIAKYVNGLSGVKVASKMDKGAGQ